MLLRFQLCLVLQASAALGLASTKHHAQQASVTLSNAHASYSFEYTTASPWEAWLSSGFLTSHPGDVVTFSPDEPMWSVALRAGGLEEVLVHPGELECATLEVQTYPPTSPLKGVFLRWCGLIPTSILPDSTRIEVVCRWELAPSNDYLTASLWEVELGTSTCAVDSPPASLVTGHRLWSVVFPDLDIRALSYSGTDRLVTGRYGGLINGNPIHYLNPGYESEEPEEGRRFFFGGGQNTIDPGDWSVPVTYYYDEPRGFGIYLANNDDSGFLKQVLLTPEPVIQLPGVPLEFSSSLRYQVTQYANDPVFATGSIYEARKFRSPYKVHVGVLRGDYVDAAKKYRAYRVNPTEGRFPWLQGDGGLPSGHPSNMTVSEELKMSPIQIRLNGTGTAIDGGGETVAGYSAGDLNVGDFDFPPDEQPQCCVLDGPTLVNELSFLESRFGPAPLLMLERIAVAHDEAKANMPHYRPRNICQQNRMRKFITDAQDRGHRVFLGSLTEKFFDAQYDSAFAFRDYDCTAPHLFCEAVDVDLRRLMRANAVDNDENPAVDHQGVKVPCSLGHAVDIPQQPFELSDPPCLFDTGTLPVFQEPEASKWVVSFLASVAGPAPGLGILGGLRLNTPGPSTRPCFQTGHHHPPGHGNALLMGWISSDPVGDNQGAGTLPEDIGGICARVQKRLPNQIMFMNGEGANGTVTRASRGLNPWNVDLALDQTNACPLTSPELSPDEIIDRADYYFDAPIRKVPMLQLVVDEARYVTGYNIDTLSLAYTGDDDKGYFQEFPAVSGSLHCWNMAKRVLGYQASILLNTRGFDLALADQSVLFPRNLAMNGVLTFYERLQDTLEAPVPPGAFGSPVSSNMGFLCGTMERPPRTFNVTGQTLVIPEATIQSFFPKLHTIMSLGYPGAKTLDYGSYRPADLHVFLPPAPSSLGSPHRPIAPDENETWLPHGIYRHCEQATKLALFVANPWGVKHLVTGVVSKPMNPFTFNYGSPPSNPQTNTYPYSFSFDPTDYGFNGNYKVVGYRFDPVLPLGTSVVPVQIYAPPAQSGPITINAQLKEFRIAVFYFEDIPG